MINLITITKKEEDKAGIHFVNIENVHNRYDQIMFIIDELMSYLLPSIENTTFAIGDTILTLDYDETTSTIDVALELDNLPSNDLEAVQHLTRIIIDLIMEKDVDELLNIINKEMENLED